MACNFYELESSYWLNELIKFANHIHLVDAKGDMDEGLNFGDGELDLLDFKNKMERKGNLSYILKFGKVTIIREKDLKKQLMK